MVGQPIYYRDSTRHADDWEWEFGNGQKVRRARGVFYYYKPGIYLIRLTVNEKNTKTFSVVATLKSFSGSTTNHGSNSRDTPSALAFILTGSRPG